MATIMNSPAAKSATSDTEVLGSIPEVEIGPVTNHTRRRVVFSGEQDDNNDTPILSDSCCKGALFEGRLMTMNCPKNRLLASFIQRKRSETYCLSTDGLRDAIMNGPALTRLNAILGSVAPNGDMLYTREYVHCSLLKTRPVLWRTLMFLVNEKYPGMYTPAHAPLISSYRFSVKFDVMDDDVIRQMFPCAPLGFGTVDKSQNHWRNRCLACRYLDRDLQEHMCSNFKTDLQAIRDFMPEIRARDTAMKWAYLGRRLVCGI